MLFNLSDRARAIAVAGVAVIVAIGLVTTPAEARYIAPLPIPSLGDMVLHEQAGLMFFAGDRSDAVVVTDLWGNVVKTIPIDSPTGLALQPDGSAVWVSSRAGGRLISIDTSTLEIDKSVSITPGAPTDVAVTDDRVIYLSDPWTLAWFSIDAPGTKDSLTLDEVAHLVEVDDSNPETVIVASTNANPGVVATYEIATKTKIAEVEYGSFITDIAVHPSGSVLAIASAYPEGMQTLTVPALTGSTVYDTPKQLQAVEWSVTGNHLVATAGSGATERVIAFEKAKRAPISRRYVDTLPSFRGAAISRDGRYVWMVGGPTSGESLPLYRESTLAPGSITGRITASDGGELDRGIADIFDWETGDYIASQSIDASGHYRFDDVEPGDYLILGSNSDDDTFYDYFGEWFDDAPLLRFEQIDPVTVKSERTTTGIDFILEPFYNDMFNTPFTADIAWMQETALTTGCGNGGYCTDDYVTRGQMAAFLVRALGLPASDAGIDFRDDDSSVFENDIEKLASAGITTGCASDRFCPNDVVTRGQMAAFLVRAMGYTERGNTDFADDNGSVFEADIERLAAAGVTTGCGPDTFCPENPVTRGQMAAFLHRALGGGILYPGSVDEPSGTGRADIPHRIRMTD